MHEALESRISADLSMAALMMSYGGRRRRPGAWVGRPALRPTPRTRRIDPALPGNPVVRATDRHGLLQAPPMPPWIGQQIAALQALSFDQLQSVWRQTHGHPAPPWLGRELLLRALAR